ncbi:substrate-binding periplasmic protein [Vibrio sp. MA40-2]|uniref:substrate-binding periplasmic protein n=1 Tax=Vibrio sp. MA40-2 TaxID=3391828 RepID=UPI0039A6B5C9
MKVVTIIAFTLSCLSIANVSADQYKIIEATDTRNKLVLEILQLALSKVDSNVELTQIPNTTNTARNVSEVEAGNVDIMWSGASPENDKRLNAVRIPILKGILGHRIFIIRKGDQPRFNHIRTLEDLKKLNGGQGKFWADTQVLKSAGLPTLTTIKYPNLFKMLEGGRFDYFPRAIHEPWPEVEQRPELNLVVEKQVMLIYPYAMLFYVNKNAKDLHEKLYKGFEMSIKDGSFDQLFFNNSAITAVLEKANLGGRSVIRIDNPFMHPDTPFDRKEFWLDLNQL